jgi:hypothetical protein
MSPRKLRCSVLLVATAFIGKEALSVSSSPTRPTHSNEPKHLFSSPAPLLSTAAATGQHISKGKEVVGGSSRVQRLTALCLTCDAGQAPDTSDGTTCVDCPAGRYSVAGSSVCYDCPAGSFSLSPGLASCSSCPDDTYSATGSSTCTLCRRHFYLTLDEKSCKPCPGGTVCPLDGGGKVETLQLKPGYWRSSIDSAVVYQCPNCADACMGGVLVATDDSDASCEKGYYGPLCAGMCR